MDVVVDVGVDVVVNVDAAAVGNAQAVGVHLLPEQDPDLATVEREAMALVVDVDVLLLMLEGPRVSAASAKLRPAGYLMPPRRAGPRRPIGLPGNRQEGCRRQHRILFSRRPKAGRAPREKTEHTADNL
eukprot:10592808-Heterocapsa_arctica.AAC.1